MALDSTTHLVSVAGTLNESNWSGVHNHTSQYTYGARVFVAIAVLIICLLGIVGNSTVLIAVALSCRLQTITNVFVANLSVADLLMSLCAFINTVILLIPGSLPRSLDNLCLLVAFMSPSVVDLDHVIRNFPFPSNTEGGYGENSVKCYVT